MTGTARAGVPVVAADHPLRRLRRRRRMTQTALGELAGLSCAYISMIERGERALTRHNHITALAAVLRVPPDELAPGAIAAGADVRASASPAPAFPAVRDQATVTRHARLVSQFLALLARRDTLAAGMWLRRTARDPAVSPWLLLDLIATRNAGMPAGTVTTGSISGTAQTAVPVAAAGHPLRRLRHRRGLTQRELAALAGLSSSYISMIERGTRALTRLDDINAIAAALHVPPAELAPAAIPAHPDLQASAPSAAPAFPAVRNEVAMTRHARLTREFLAHASDRDTAAAGMWLRRTARDPGVNPWLLLDLIATHYAGRTGPRSHQATDRLRKPDGSPRGAQAPG